MGIKEKRIITIMAIEKLFACLTYILFLLGFQDFLKVIGFVGGIMLGMEGILILLMYKKIKPGKMALVYPLILVFLGGILYEITSFLK